MSEVFEFGLAFGWSAPSIKEQIEAFGPEDVEPKQITQWQKDADALLRCAIRGLIPASAVNKARNKMAVEVEKYLVENGHFQAAAD